MRTQRTVLGLLLGLAAAAAVAQPNDAPRWRRGSAALGLQPTARAPQLQCGPFSLACNASTTLPLYASPVAPRSIGLQVGYVDGTALKAPRPQGLSLAVVGKAGLFADVGVYGRVGTTVTRGSGLAGAPVTDRGLSYGVGLSWDFSRRGSAMFGFESYDVRGQAGDVRDVRSTNLGLQWRY
jgi:OmpA-OmpF porin, OOP family